MIKRGGRKKFPGVPKHKSDFGLDLLLGLLSELLTAQFH